MNGRKRSVRKKKRKKKRERERRWRERKREKKGEEIGKMRSRRKAVKSSRRRIVKTGCSVKIFTVFIYYKYIYP